MSRAHTITTTTIDRWLLPHIAGVTAYADTDLAFAVMLATWLDEENWAVTATPSTDSSRFLTPKNIEEAEDIVDWLMHELVTHPEARIARSTLMSWAGSFQIPQDLVIEPNGLTLTRSPLEKANRNRTKPKLQIVVNEAWQKDQSIVTLTEQTHAVSQQLMATELRKAGGKVGSLHPDSAEWCIAATQTKLYAASTADLLTLQQTAQEEGVHHISHQTNDGLTMLAISPHVQDSFVEELIG